MSERNDTYMELVTLLMAALIILMMFAMAEAAPSQERLVGNLDTRWTDHILAVDQALAKKNVSAARAALHQTDLLHGDSQPWPGASWGEGSGHVRVNPSKGGAR